MKSKMHFRKRHRLREGDKKSDWRRRKGGAGADDNDDDDEDDDDRRARRSYNIRDSPTYEPYRERSVIAFGPVYSIVFFRLQYFYLSLSKILISRLHPTSPADPTRIVPQRLRA